jgi:proline iminopeptidase
VNSGDLYSEIDPDTHGFLEVDEGNRVYWECCGNPDGKPAVVLHGGPGSGCSPWHRRLFDPNVYRIVLLDQRNCGRSTPHASDHATNLAHNTTNHLLNDIEQLRQRLGVDRWLVVGGSWGSTLALAYAETHPNRVGGMILFGVTTGQRREFDWLFRGGLARLFPQEWDRLRSWLPEEQRDEDIVAAYQRLLNSPDPSICQQAALEWCMWESATPDWPPKIGLAPRFTNPKYALAFARIVTHYVLHNAWLEDGILIQNAEKLADIPGILINGRFDLQAPMANAWELKRAWKKADLVIVENAGHVANTTEISREIVRATNRFAASGS